MAKTDGQTRSGRRIGTKSHKRAACQRATAGVVRRSRRPVQYVGTASQSPFASVGTPGAATVPAEPTTASYVLANRSKRTVEVRAESDEQARMKAVQVGLVKKPENARIVSRDGVPA